MKHACGTANSHEFNVLYLREIFTAYTIVTIDNDSGDDDDDNADGDM